MENRGGQNKRALYVQICVIFLMICFSFLFLIDGINLINNMVLSYDEAYNATVAANLFRYGEYRVSYPDNIVFYNMITTGETVILPTALLYSLFGINNITTTIVPLLYALLSIWCIWILLCNTFKEFFDYSWMMVITFAMTVGVILTDKFFYYIACHLMGESACVFFLLLLFVCLMIFFRRRRNKFLLFAGAMLAFAFLTKSSMIFFVITIYGMMIVETFIVKRISVKELFYFGGGFGLGFILLDSYKFIQLGGMLEYLNWWKMEWENMMNQSSGIDVTYNFAEKFQFLHDIFGYNKWICIIYVLLPVTMYLLYLLRYVKKEKIFSNEHWVMLVLGTGGASLLIYFLLLGGSGLLYARRHSVNALFVKIFSVYLLGQLFVFVRHNLGDISKRQIILSTMFLTLGSFLLFQPQRIYKNFMALFSRENQPSYEQILMEEFLEEINGIPQSATLYCVGWWQEPDITLFLDRKMIDINDVIYGKGNLADDSYFIVGNFIDGIKVKDIENGVNASLIRVDTSEVDYNVFNSFFNREDFDNFAIYKIVPHQRS